MKKEILDILLAWNKQQKELLKTQKDFEATPLIISKLSSDIKTEIQAARAFSKVLGIEIRHTAIFWGIPIALNEKKTNLESNYGYIYSIPNIGCFLIWQNGNNVLFFDKDIFKVEICFKFRSIRNTPPTTLVEELKKRIIAFIIMAIVIILSLIFK